MKNFFWFWKQAYINTQTPQNINKITFLIKFQEYFEKMETRNLFNEIKETLLKWRISFDFESKHT